ncbi:copper transporter 6-like [Phalaenopsis equestris]|uniref:copper transporter 6-like n=1 Tax=Phalaenopsis equestris TaxID=78828 RepID=UPI0009E424FB|nr:copper transporter 6-like [Phalaenopsis equestris]
MDGGMGGNGSPGMHGGGTGGGMGGMGGMGGGTGGGTGGGMAQMAFYWGERPQILFFGWPGNRGQHIYILALLLVAAVAAISECLSILSRRFAPQSSTRASFRPAFGLALTAVHTLKMGLLYLVMLAVMSFNVGVFIAAVAGHAIGFLIVGSGVFRWARAGGPHAEDANTLGSADKI